MKQLNNYLEYRITVVKWYDLASLLLVVTVFTYLNRQEPFLSFQRCALGASIVSATFILAKLCRPWVERIVLNLQPLTDANLISTFHKLAQRAGIRPGPVFFWDTGGRILDVGVVGNREAGYYMLISDYLLQAFTSAETRAVMAHEVGHLRAGHLRGGLCLDCKIALMLFLCLLLIPGVVLQTDSVPEVFLVWAGITLIVHRVHAHKGANLRYRFEFEADHIAVELTGDLATYEAMLRKAYSDMPEEWPEEWPGAVKTWFPSLGARLEQLRKEFSWELQHLHDKRRRAADDGE